MGTLAIIEPVAIAMGLGILVGLQREWAASQLAGIRTFPLLAALGALCGLLAMHYGGWIVAAGLAGVAVLMVVGNLSKMRLGQADPGVTTEAAALVMYAIGAALAADLTVPAVIVGGAVAVLLHIKDPLHGLVRRLGQADLKALIQFVLLALVVLPLLPDEGYGPFEVLNPFEIWLMVVLIVGLSLAAYVAHKLLSARTGTLLSGLLGGLISSTATTVSYARRVRNNPRAARVGAAVVMIASTIAFARVLFEIGVVARSSLPQLAPPLAAAMGLMLVLACVVYLRARRAAREDVPLQGDPADLKTALAFGVVYAAVIFAVAAAKHWLGPGALYAVATLSGLTDMDAITLSTARLDDRGALDAATGWRLILVASLANLALKGVAAAALGGRALAGRLAAPFGLALASGVAILLLWPNGSLDGAPAATPETSPAETSPETTQAR